MVVSEELHLAGPVTANLSFSCNEIDSFVMARLSRVDGQGGLHPLSFGVIAPSRRKIDVTRGSATEIALDTDHRPSRAATARQAGRSAF